MSGTTTSRTGVTLVTGATTGVTLVTGAITTGCGVGFVGVTVATAICGAEIAGGVATTAETITAGAAFTTVGELYAGGAFTTVGKLYGRVAGAVKSDTCCTKETAF